MWSITWVPARPSFTFPQSGGNSIGYIVGVAVSKGVIVNVGSHVGVDVTVEVEVAGKGVEVLSIVGAVGETGGWLWLAMHELRAILMMKDAKSK